MRSEACDLSTASISRSQINADGPIIDDSNLNQLNSFPDLPATVQETLEITVISNDFLQYPIETYKDVQKTYEEKMITQEEVAGGTQVLSQSIYQSILQRGKSTTNPVTTNESHERSIETQQTLNEGDHGHVDITSSFNVKRDHDEDDEDSEPLDFSPTQNNLNLTDFPESQRFKTPATAGRKRKYNDELDESPDLPRNPLLRERQPTPGKLMGLSQAFAGTQAVSSPFANGLPTGLRSDRPSPNVDLRTRPMSASSSSPYKHLASVKRATTEPASRYVPMNQSQSKRAQKGEEIEAVQVDSVYDHDTFEDESSTAVLRRRQREREIEIQHELEAYSSPTIATRARTRTKVTSPRDGHRRAGSQDAASPPERGIAAPLEAMHSSTSLDSEAETDRDEEPTDKQPPVSRSRLDEDNKENDVQRVQETVAPPQRRVNGPLPYIEASPLVRHATRNNGSGELQSSGPFRIPNSQPTRSQAGISSSLPSFPGFRIGNPVDSAKLSQSNGEPDLLTDENPNEHSADLHQMENTVDGLTNEAKDSSTESPDDTRATIPETDNDVLGNDTNIEINENRDLRSHSSKTNFDTVPTHQRSSATSGSSSQPVTRTPPRGRRMRMDQISAEPPSAKSQPSFDADAALQLDDDRNVIEFLQTTPKARATYSDRKRRAGGLARVGSHQPDVSSNKMSSNKMSSNKMSSNKMSNEATAEPSFSPPTPEPSQEIIQPARTRRITRPSISQSLAPSRTRGDIFELDASPQRQKDSSMILNTKKHSSLIKSAPKAIRTGGRSDTAVESYADQVGEHGRQQGRAVLVTETNHTEKRLQNDNSQDPVVAPNMVFACFNGKVRAYYPATCLGYAQTGSNKFLIQWEGYDPDEIDAYGIKSLDLRIGDLVKVNLDQWPKVPYVVRGFKDKKDSVDGITDIRGHQTLIVAAKARKSLPSKLVAESRQEVPVGAIYLDNNMWQQMKSRDYSFVPNTPASGMMEVATPTDHGSTPSTPPSRQRRIGQVANDVSNITPSASGIFANMAFALSYDETSRKNSLVEMVQNNGGIILRESFPDLFDSSLSALRDQYQSLGFVALLTERHSRKEKYMQALALGLPCLSGRWIEACVTKAAIVDWHTYLLPSGESAELDGAIRSRNLSFGDASSTKLVDMLASKPNILDNADVVVVCGKGKFEARRLPYIFLLQAMGAGKIEKVIDITSAQETVRSQGAEVYQWMFVDDRDLAMAQSLVSSKVTKSQRKKSNLDADCSSKQFSVKLGGNETIIQSLILGRLYEPK